MRDKKLFWGGKERETEEWRRVELSEGNREVREGERETEEWRRVELSEGNREVREGERETEE